MTRYLARLVLLCLVLHLGPVHASAPLPALKAAPGAVSVSGLSSGAFMAGQYQVAYSASVIGAGIVAGGPYYCAMGNVLNTEICMGQYPLLPPNANLFWMLTEGFAADRAIDPVSNLAGRRIYIFSGTNDTVVAQLAVNATATFFQAAGVPAQNLAYVNRMPAGHALITPRTGNDCPANATPYVSHCAAAGGDYDQPGAILQHIYGSLQAPAAPVPASLLTFDQAEFAAASTSMAADAFVYVPASCQGGGCRLHVAFHGCKQSPQDIGDAFYWKSSYNAWAEANNIIVLYPQVIASAPLNMDGCWDWYGYSGYNYAVKSGPQMLAVRQMIVRLTAQ
jgi:hypothetical protein